MTDAVIVSTARTPIGKAHRGALNLTRGADLAAHAIRGALDRARLEPGAVDKRCFRGKTALWAGDMQALGAKNAGEFVGKTVDDVSFRHVSSLALCLRYVRAGRWMIRA